MAKKPSFSQLEKELATLTEALKRERADSENIRRRHAEDIAGLKNLIKASVVRELLPVIDNFDRALKHVPKELEKNDYVKGVNAIVLQFEKTLGQLGVERIKTVGEVFNPHFHEAVSMEEAGGLVEVVAEELQPGYCLGNEVIRHAMVKVKTQSAPKPIGEGGEDKK